MGLDWADWSRWIRGLIGAGISGAANSIVAGGVVSVLAPDKFNLQTSEAFRNLMCAVGYTALGAFVISISKYLATKPLPEDDAI